MCSKQREDIYNVLEGKYGEKERGRDNERWRET